MVDQVARAILEDGLRDLHTEVAVFSPASAPGVLESDERIASQTVSNSEHGVIESRSAAFRIIDGVVDSGRVIPKASSNFVSNSDGSLSKVLKENVHSVLRKNNGAGLDGILVHIREAGTNTVGSGVREDRLSVNAFFDDVIKSLVRPASAASVVAPGRGSAADELLLRQVQGAAVIDQVGRLNRGDGGEGPAGSTVALVFDRGDLSETFPVLFAGNRKGIELAAEEVKADDELFEGLQIENVSGERRLVFILLQVERVSIRVIIISVFNDSFLRFIPIFSFNAEETSDSLIFSEIREVVQALEIADVGNCIVAIDFCAAFQIERVSLPNFLTNVSFAVCLEVLSVFRSEVNNQFDIGGGCSGGQRTKPRILNSLFRKGCFGNWLLVFSRTDKFLSV